MKKVDVIIFGGQSNMQGQSDCLSECEAVAGALEYKFLSDTLVPLKNPVGEDIRYDGLADVAFTEGSSLKVWLSSHVLGAAAYGHTNLVPAFCRAYIQKTARSVIAVHAAKGSTEISEWLPETEGYRALVKKAKAAINKAKTQCEIEHIYFVWLQGESDAIAGNSKDYYKKKLAILGAALVQDLGVDRFGIIRVGRFTEDERDLEIISAQDEICAEAPFFLMLTRASTELNKDPEMMNPNVKGHYSAKGLETLGTLAGEALAEKNSIFSETF